MVDLLTVPLENRPPDDRRLGNTRDQQGFVSNGVGLGKFAYLAGRCRESLRAEFAFTA
jgi:hypothetical protein